MAIADPVEIDLDTLRARCAGAVVAPGDEAYEQARQPWNLAVDQRPPAVAFPADAADVACVVTAARDAGVRVAVQGTGHGAAALGDVSASILLRTTAMTGVRIDADARVARASAGALWDDVVPVAAEHGLAPLAGSSPDVGVVGYTLGGGVGYLSRRHGLACNRVTAVELVTANGELVRADHEHDPELFWALRGGGGSFGVVCAMEFSLVPVAELHAGGLMWPWEQAPQVLERWRELTLRAPRELTTMGRLLQIPPFPEIPAPLRGRRFVNVQAAFEGSADEAGALLRPLRELGPELDTFAAMDPGGLLRIHGDPEGPSPGMLGHALLDDLPADALDALLAVVGPGSESPLVSVELRHLGGALAEAPEGAGALALLEGAFSLVTVGIPTGPEAIAAIAERGRRLEGALAPFGSGRFMRNFLDRPGEAAGAMPADSLARLEAVRDRADPESTFHTGLRLD